MSLAMGMTAWFVITPLCFASVATGLVQALGSTWGLLRHYWILFKLLLTALATLVLLLKLPPISDLAEAAARASFSVADSAGLRTSLAVHAAGGLAILLAATTLAVYKPTGLTRYGLRSQASSAAVHDGAAARTPRWARVFGLLFIVLILLVGSMMLFGGHGPRVHRG